MKNYFFSDLSVMLERSMRHIFRSLDTIITITLSPIGIMLLFVYVLGGAIKTGTDNYVNYLLPGILIMSISSGIANVSYHIFLDMQSGIIERFRSMPIAKSAVIWGHILTSLVSNAISVVVIIIVALIIGFRSSADILSWLGVAGILAIFILALTWIAVIVGLKAKSVDGATVFAYPLSFLPFISSAFVPTATMSGPVRAFAENQPVTAIVSSIRALLSNQSLGNEIWVALAWCFGIIFVAYFFAMKVFNNRA